MPCYDGEPQTTEFEAMLCGIATTLEKNNMLDNVLSSVNWAETGLGRYHFDRWWYDHKVRDERERAREQAEKEAAELRANVLKKLTPEERRALGIEM